MYSGTLKAGSYVMNTTKGRRERVGRLLQLHANSREQRDEVYAGELVAAIGLSNTGPATRWSRPTTTSGSCSRR